MTYNIPSYGAMMADPLRCEPYLEALRRTVRPGSVVVDLGTGTGVHALMAAQLGARRVIAIEPSPAIELARAIARDNGLADRIEFVRAPSQTVTLDEPADVVVSDIRGRLPLLRDNLGAIRDARRFLAPGGTFIPKRDDLLVAAFEDPQLYAKVVSPWSDNPLGLDMSAGRALVLHHMHTGKVGPGGVLTAGARWATLDYHGDLADNVGGKVDLRPTRAGTLHGLVLWFEATLVDGVTFSTSPDSPDSVYGRTFLAVPEPVPVTPEDTVTVDLAAALIGGDYVWRWRTAVTAMSGDGPAGAPKASFEQSTFFSSPLSTDRLAGRRADHTVHLTREGAVHRYVLERLDAGARLGEIATELSLRYPDWYPLTNAALATVADIAEKFGAG